MGQVLLDPSLYLALSILLPSFYSLKIETGQLTPHFKTTRAHVKHVKNTFQVKQERLQQVTDTQRCTKCGADMVKRTATKSKNADNEFLGCSAFPKCRSVFRL